MRKVPHQQAKIPEVRKPVLTGSWHGKDAYRLGRKVMLGTLMVSVVYPLLSIMLSFDSIAVRIVLALALVLGAVASFYTMGVQNGTGDAAFAEIMYQRNAEGKAIPPAERERCYHPGKGFFAVLVGIAPFIIITAVFACITGPTYYTLSPLPGWVQGLWRANGFGEALGYYQAGTGFGTMDIYRIVTRAMVMPFVNVAMPLGEKVVLWVERFSPLLVCIAPFGFGLGYTKGIEARSRIHTAIEIGERKKRRKARRDKKRRMESKTPERLI